MIWIQLVTLRFGLTVMVIEGEEMIAMGAMTIGLNYGRDFWRCMRIMVGVWSSREKTTERIRHGVNLG